MGKPIRCRDCMNKVNDGTASKEELAAEREILKSARSEMLEKSGVKLFVGSICGMQRGRFEKIFFMVNLKMCISRKTVKLENQVSPSLSLQIKRWSEGS